MMERETNVLNFPLQVNDVVGYDGRTNNVIYCQPRTETSENKVVFYFGGDIQDFSEMMILHSDKVNFRKWNLNNMAVILSNYFPQHHIVVVQPSRYEYTTFSCYDNFVPSDDYGVPEHTPNHNAIRHLDGLLNNLAIHVNHMYAQKLKEIESTNNGSENQGTLQEELQDEPSTPPVQDFDSLLKFQFTKAKWTLIGFSKGCVVLNQFIYEFHYAKTLMPSNEHMARLISQVTDMYFIDGGHHGKKNTWVTSRSFLDTLTRLGIMIHIHVTPYQVQDIKRPWIGKEERLFYETLQALGANVERKLHFTRQGGTLDSHFDILSMFEEHSN